MIREIKEKIENAYIEVKEAERLGDGYKELHETRKPSLTWPVRR